MSINKRRYNYFHRIENQFKKLMMTSHNGHKMITKAHMNSSLPNQTERYSDEKDIKEFWRCHLKKMAGMKFCYNWPDGFGKPFPTYRHFLTPLQQMTFENIVTKEEIAQDQQFLLLPKLYSIILILLIKICHIFA